MVCGQGTAPAGATAEALRGPRPRPGAGQRAARRAPCPARSAAGCCCCASTARCRLRDVLGYAIGYAAGRVSPDPGDQLVDRQRRRPVPRALAPPPAEVYLPGGGVPAPGSRFANRALAATYERVLAEAEAAGDDRDAQLEAARRAWYDGFVAEEIGKFAATEVMDVTGERHRGLLTAQDLSTWHARLEAPVTLRLPRADRLQDRPVGPGPGLPAAARAARAATTSRAMGPGGAGVHPHRDRGGQARLRRPRGLVRRPRVHRRAARRPAVGRRTTTSGASSSARPRAWSCGPASPGGREPGLPGFATRPFGMNGPPAPPQARLAGQRRPGHRPGDRRAARPVATARAGAGAATPATSTSRTAGATWSPRRRAAAGCSPRRSSRRSGSASAPGRRCSRSSPGLPATIAPGKRPRTTLTPTLALRDGEPYLAFGTPGGDQQDQWTLGFFLNHVHFGMNLQQAIDFPAFHSAHMPSSFYPREAYPGRLDVESRVGDAVIGELRRRGHDVHVQPPWSLGRISAVARRERHALRRRQPPRHAGLRRGPVTRASRRSANAGRAERRR